MSITDYSLKNYLYQLRMYRGYSQKQLAGLLDLTPRAFSDLEKGRRLPPLRTAMQMEIALGTKLSEIYSDLYAELGRTLVARERQLPERFSRHILGRVLRKDPDEFVRAGGGEPEELPPEDASSIRGVQCRLPF